MPGLLRETLAETASSTNTTHVIDRRRNAGCSTEQGAWTSGGLARQQGVAPGVILVPAGLRTIPGVAPFPAYRRGATPRQPALGRRTTRGAIIPKVFRPESVPS